MKSLLSGCCAASWVLVVGCGTHAEHDARAADVSDGSAQHEGRAADVSDGRVQHEGRAADASPGVTARDSGSVSASTAEPPCKASTYVVHGAACTTPGAEATGPAPECGDQHHTCPLPTVCSCVAEKWSCPRCPRCLVDLAHPNRELGGGIQLCEGATLKQCDGTTREVSGFCSYRGTSLWCSATEDIALGCSDAGSVVVRDAGLDGATP